MALLLSYFGNSSCSTMNSTEWSYSFPVATSIHSSQWPVDRYLDVESVIFITNDTLACDPSFYATLGSMESRPVVIFTSDAGCKLESKLQYTIESLPTAIAFVYHREIAAEGRRPPGRGYRQPLQIQSPLPFVVTLIAYEDFVILSEYLANYTDTQRLNGAVSLRLEEERNQWQELFEGGLFLFLIYFFVSLFSIALIAAIYKLAIFGLYASKVGGERYNEAFFLLVNECVLSIFLILSFIDYFGNRGIFTFTGQLAVTNLCILFTSVSNLLLMMLWVQTIRGATEIPDMQARLVALQRVKWPFFGIMSAQMVLFVILISITDAIVVFTPNSAAAFFFPTYLPSIAYAITLIVYGAKLDKLVGRIAGNLGRKRKGYQKSILPSTLLSSIPLIVLFGFEAFVYIGRLGDLVEFSILQVIVRGAMLALPLWVKVWYFNPVKANLVGIDPSKSCLGGFFLLPSCIVGSASASTQASTNQTKSASTHGTELQVVDI
jgi:hypothetical protein